MPGNEEKIGLALIVHLENGETVVGGRSWSDTPNRGCNNVANVDCIPLNAILYNQHETKSRRSSS